VPLSPAATVGRIGCCTAALIVIMGFTGFVSVRLFLWPPCVAEADIIFLPCGFFFYLLSFFFLFFLA